MNDRADELFFTPGLDDAGLRIDVYLTEVIDNQSRSAVQHLLRGGHVSADGKPVKQNYRIRGGETIRVVVPDPVPAAVAAEDIPLDIVYEDADIIVVNKPRGMVVHPAAGNYTGTLAHALLYHCGGSLSGINGVMRPGIVHRIDKDTSGLVVAAKHDAAHRALAAQLHAHTIERVYNAVVCGVIANDGGVVDKPIGRHPKDRKKMAVVPNGRPAVTRFTVLERFERYTFIEARLQTGRTHQIRVHMASIGRPVYGDAVYGTAVPGVDGQVLHSARLAFTHPITGASLNFTSELPEYFRTILEGLA